MLIQLLQQLAALKQRQLQAQMQRNQAEIEQLDRQIQDCDEAIERARCQQKTLKRDEN